MEEVVLGFSGGVDSAVAALLLREQGYRVRGVYLDNADEAARREAEAGAEELGIPLRSIDVRQELEALVCRPFTEAYLRGETPIPCILCNPALKFRTLLEAADEAGCRFIATGHYARAEQGSIYRGRPENDQSYMLCRLTREQAARTILPLGALEKRETRAIAAAHGLHTAAKPDSQEICFIPDRDYRSWIASRGFPPVPGAFLLHGERFGTHSGIYHYTVGQRLPGFYDGRKVYVSKINAADNTIELAWWEELFRTELTVRDFCWLCDPPEGSFRAAVRVRHTKWETPECTVTVGQETVRIVCDEPVRAPAAGQSAVLYDGERLLGGGFLV